MRQLFNVLSGVMLLVFFISPTSYAFNVVFTESEFRMQSEHCKRYYSVTQIGRSLNYTLKMTPDEFRIAHQDAEQAGGAWHYCAGIVIAARALHEASPEKKQALYKQSLLEIAFSARKISQDHRIYGEMMLNQAKVTFLLGEKEQSKHLLRQLLNQIPTYVPGKVELARQLAKDNNLKSAIDILLSVSPEQRDKSADLNYALGLYLFKSGNYDDSYLYAQKAYKLNYPLPWLKNQLVKKGFKF